MVECEFQSSPAPKDRCNVDRLNRAAVDRLFQSSPAPKDRCNSIWYWIALCC